MEADLSRYHQIDYRDRWRPDEHGRPRLTLRGIYVRVRHLPEDSAVVQAQGGPGWVVGDYLLADLFQLWAEERHPARPKPSRSTVPDPARARALRAARERAKERRRRIEAGALT